MLGIVFLSHLDSCILAPGFYFTHQFLYLFWMLGSNVIFFSRVIRQVVELHTMLKIEIYQLVIARTYCGRYIIAGRVGTFRCFMPEKIALVQLFLPFTVE